MRLVYSAEAVVDLQRLRQFIAAHNPLAAARVGAELVARLDHLARFPELGQRIAQSPAASDIRDFYFGKYAVRYSVHDSAVVVLRIWHHLESRSSI